MTMITDEGMPLEIEESKLVCPDVCAWPNMQRFPDGRLVVTFGNTPGHAITESGVDIMFSSDDGITWGGRRTVFSPEPGQCRGNSAFYVGDDMMLILCGGWVLPRVRCLTPATLILSGKDLEKSDFRLETKGLFPLAWVPFGNIYRAGDGSLRAAIYLNLNGLTETFMMRSADNGESWRVHGRIAERCNETAILPLEDGHWLAAVRTEPMGILQYESKDDGLTWNYVQQLTLRRQVTGHLMQLKDGRILLSNGNRNQGHFGVDVRLSEDGGKLWGEPVRLVETPHSDCGYPTTIECADGSLLTLYYTKTATSYEMRSVRFRIK